jgi:hypothetical protein
LKRNIARSGPLWLLQQWSETWPTTTPQTTSSASGTS